MAQSRQEYVPVTIDMRALVDKVLARYSAKFSVFRELLQNSDDAGCDSAEIRFETAASSPLDPEAVVGDGPPILPDLDAHVVQWTFRNHGKLFRPQDWLRLPRIALGNPDPTKIGAFGVGFFSVFSITDNPCVSSGDKEMEFQWDEENQLRYRFDGLPIAETRDLWTTFKIPLREAAPMPPIAELMQFLASSITFMIRLESVAIFFDGRRVGQINKSLGHPQLIPIPDELRRSSPENIMTVKSVEKHPITIDARITHPQCELHETKDVTVFTAEVDVTVDTKFSKELDRCMKKKPPSHLKYRLTYTSKDDHDRSHKSEQNNLFPSPLQGLCTDLDGAVHSRVYIGHATAQTTGIGGHMASHFIPTVERESIDLADINVGTWNRELLYVGGILCRAVYELELSEIQDSWEEAAASEPDLRPSRELQNQLHKRFLHVLKFFTFHPSTPSSTVAELLADSFYGCSTLPLRLLSSVGVRGAPHVREFDAVLAKFLKSVPMLSEYVTQYGAGSVAALPDKHKISAITPSDILQDLRDHTLDTEELVAFLRWWMTPARDELTLDPVDLWNAATLCGDTDKDIYLSSVTSFIDPKVLGLHIPPDGPLPLSLIPIGVSKHFDFKELVSLGLKEFTVALWLCHLSDPDVVSADEEHNFTRSVDWAGRVLSTLSRVWSQLPEDIRRESRKAFRNKPCIPTSKGLCCPECSYLPITDGTQFQHLDLPIVSWNPGFEADTDMERCLVSLGVRKDPPVHFLLDQMRPRGNWTVLDLIKYLVQEERSLTDDDISGLKLTKIFMKEDSQGSSDSEEIVGYCADELFPPVDTFRKLQLPVIEWSGKLEWRETSSEAQLLYRLGLNRLPPLPKIMELCSSEDGEVQETAFTYLCRELQSRYSAYKPEDFQDLEFIPAESNERTCLKKLSEVYSVTQWKALGFFVVPRRYMSMPLDQLGVMHQPPTSKISDLLENTPPRDEQTARRWFEVLSDHISAFSSLDRNKLLGLPFVPIGSSGALNLLPPTKCYLDQGFKPKLYTKLFAFVDFGDRANDFLRACGLKNQVVIEDVAEVLIENPQQFFDFAGGYEGFLVELRKIAYQRRDISNPTLHNMSDKRALLGVHRQKAEGQDKWHYDYKFLTSQEVTIVDDSDDYQLFSDRLFVAPQEEVLESFYASLGCSYLSAVVKERFHGLHGIPAPEICLDIQSRILQRLPLFIQKYTDTKPKVKIPSCPDDLKVKACRNIRVFKTLVTVNGNVERSRDVRAIARHEGDCVELWISKTAKRDMYEVATSLCRLLFGTNKTNATLLLEKVLSADWEGLERRGFVVDKVPERQGGTYGRKNKARRKHLHNSGTLHKSSEIISQSPSHLHDDGVPVKKVHEVLTNVPGDDTLDTVEQSASIPLSRTPRGVIPQKDIRNNAEVAINACGQGREKSTTHVGARQFSSSFCRLFADVKGLRLVDQVNDIPVYVDEGMPGTDTFMARKQGPLVRFVDIISTLCQVYQIPVTTMCIFCDVSGGCIAFNCQRVIYLNLRYFEAWHDKQVEDGNRQDALMWWFLALAHEIAHNEIDQHNADHEFLFSAICEARLAKFSQLLQPGVRNAWPRRVLWPILSVIVVLFAYVVARMVPVAKTF